MKVVLKKLSLCPCGFTFLNDKATLGTVYEIDRGRATMAGFVCGGCRKIHRDVNCVWTYGNVQPGFLPVALFELFKIRISGMPPKTWIDEVSGATGSFHGGQIAYSEKYPGEPDLADLLWLLKEVQTKADLIRVYAKKRSDRVH